MGGARGARRPHRGPEADESHAERDERPAHHHEKEGDMDIYEFFELAQEFANLGSAIGEQVKDAAAAYAESGEENPIRELELNPNAFSDPSAQRFIRHLANLDADVDGAEEFAAIIDAELAKPHDDLWVA